MTVPSVPAGYDVAYHVQAGRSDCHITAGFDRQGTHIPRFLVQLHYQTRANPVRWERIARMDHNETSANGHDVYREGLHIDVARRSSATVTLQPPHAPLPSNRGTVIRGCVKYLRDEADVFIDIFEERRHPGGAPNWSPDGGESPPTFIYPRSQDGTMSRETPAGEPEILSVDELTELLADATGTTAEEIEQGADALEIAPPEEADVVETDDE